MKDIKMMQTVAKDLNEVLGLDPPIKTDSNNPKYLADIIKEASRLIAPEDDLSKETMLYLTRNGLMPTEEDKR